MSTIQEITDKTASYFIRGLVSNPFSRKWLNKIYLKLNYSQKKRFHEKFAKIFRNKNFYGQNGFWKIIFDGKKVLIPLRMEQIWLDWDTAISVLGHDIEVKETYEALISAPNPPGLFIDIGANYGTHSLLFLVHQIETLTFEPNTACHNFFREMCKLNEVTPNIEAVALGERNRNVELSYPERRTWFGSTNAEVTKELAAKHDLVSETIEQKTLDEYVPKMRDKETVIKIDTEGNELAVLQGAEKVLQEIKPLVIFESWDDSNRLDLLHFFKLQNYKIFETPWKPNDKKQHLNSEQFINSISSNFAAIPAI